jgi:TonB family protein
MNKFIWNLIEVNVVIVLLFLGYLAIRNRLSFKQQRGVLLAAPFLAILGVLVKSWIDISNVSYSIPIVKLEPIFVGQQPAVMSLSEPSLSLTFYYGIGVIVISAILIFRLTKLGLFFARNKSESKGKYHIYKVDGKSSFSFFNRIQITPSLSAEEQEIVLEHEIMHVDKKHSIDNMVTELLHVVFWFNPIFFFIKRELINLHEFEVDDVMFKKHQVGYMKFLLNFALGTTTSNYLLTSRFYNKLTLKKRIKIMKTNYKKSSWLLGLIPIAAIAVTLVQCTKEDVGPDVTESAENTFEREPVADGFNLYGSEEASAMMYFKQIWSGDSEDIPFMVFVAENTTYPQEAIENGEEGNVIVEFIVSPEGTIENCWIKEGVSESLDKEALRVVSEAPYFEPTIVDGKPIRVQYWAPIIFELADAERMNDPNKSDLSEKLEHWNDDNWTDRNE